MNDLANNNNSNPVLFELNKRLTSSDDLDILSLYLENRKQSGGGDIVCIEELNDKTTTSALRVYYEEAEVCQRVLAKKFFQYQSFLLRSSINGYKVNHQYEIDDRRIILKNIKPNEDEFVIQMYAEYLLPENSVVEVSPLNLISDTCCVYYEQALDMDLLRKRHAKKLTLRNRPIQIHNAYKTDTLVIKSSSSASPDFIRDKLTAAFPDTLNSDTTPFMFMEETCGQVICQFEDSNIEILARIVLKEHQIVSDYCYNFDLINGSIKTSNDQSSEIILESKKKEKIFGSEVSVKVEASSALGSVLGACKQIFDDLKKNAKELGGDLRKTSDGSYDIVSVEKTDLDVLKWDKDIRSLINNYEVSRLKRKKVSIPVNLRKEKELNDLKKHINFNFKLPQNSLQYSVNSDSIALLGYTATVKSFTDNIHSKFNNLENNIKDRCKRKLDAIFSVAKIPNMCVLSYSGGYYLKEFATQLANIEAEVELLNAEATKLKINCKMNSNKKHKENCVIEWRNRVDSFVTTYFSKFKIGNIQLKGCNNVEDAMVRLSAVGFNDKMKLKLVKGSSFEVTGLSSDVEKVLSSYENINKTLSEPVPKENTFQICDLKWFQTRMLFERKYFQFVSEAYTNLDVMIDTNLTRVWYKGQKQDVDDAKKLALDILDKILGTEVKASTETLKQMVENETLLNGLIKQNGLCCIVDAKSATDKYTIYGTSKEEIGKCKYILAEIKL